MNTNPATLVASLTFLVSAACSAPPTEAAPESTTAAETDEATGAVESAKGAPYVLLEESAAGYTLTTLGSGATSHAAALDLTAVGAEAAAMVSSLALPGTIAARGTMREGGTFVVGDLYRALPNTNVTPQATVYLAHAGAHGADTASVVNMGKTRAFHALDLTGAADRFVDRTWLSARVLDGDALVAGSIASGVLHASAVLVHVPEDVTCDAPVEPCAAGTVPTYARDANRCLVAAGCERHEMCPMYIAQCQPGYVRTSWPGAHGCPAFACDPDFDPAP
jgi:hypothetical protein